jgi:hypothetical protein
MSNSISVTFGGAIELILKPPPREGRVIVTATCDHFQAKGTDMAYTLPGGMQVHVRVDYVDANGHPAVVDGAVTWDSSAIDVVSVSADPVDTQNAVVVAGATLGTAQISATADADLGAGVRNVITIFDVTVVAGEAVSGTISPVGDPEPIPAP